MSQRYGEDQLKQVAGRFSRARGRKPPATKSPLESLSPDDLGMGNLVQAGGGEATDKPEVTPAVAKPQAAGAREVVDQILRDAQARSKGRFEDVRRSISNERIIGRGDLQDLNYLEVGIAVARGVARIRVPGGSGTGSLIGPRIIMTNNHVIGSPAELDSRSRAQFDVQDDADGRPLPQQAFALDPGFFFFTSKELDITLIGIAERSDAGRPASMYPWVRIGPADSDLKDKDALTIIQHPLGGMKQIAFRNNDVIVVQDLPQFVHYTTDTQPGSSGSPCFDDLWRLVALHHSGVPATNAEGKLLTRDKTVYDPAVHSADAILWVANEGARMSAIADVLKKAALSSDHAFRRDQFFGDEPPNPVALARQVPPPSPNEEQPSGPHRISSFKNGRLSVVVDISGDEICGVHIERSPAAESSSFGVTQGPTGSLPAPSGPSQGPPSEPLNDTDETITIDKDWKARKGYDPDFLGIHIPLPMLNEEQRKVTLRVPDLYQKQGEDPLVFKYHHYSIAFNKKRHIAWYSAANVDGDQRKHKYAREKDKWFFDERMDSKDQPVHQLGESFYAAANTDRGHLTRYLDVQWGATLDETRKATNDSFHFSNCALQVSGFNQGKDRWQGIERFLLEEKARKEKRRMIVITGPVLRANDPFYRTEKMDAAVRIPLSFWKLCALVPNDDRDLAVTAFVLGQPDAADLEDVEEKFDVTAVQVTVAKLAKITGFIFDKKLLDNDHFAKKGAGSLEAIGLMRDEDIVV
ncbi:MAG TPA: DNA/RNA non-specific endonuclease [Kofleriaceae bacterium]|nr:DNA/RNA non-specific endonuclease [Kofleriaceae bacterium]